MSTGSAEESLTEVGMKITCLALEPTAKSVSWICPQTRKEDATISGSDGVVGLIRTFNRSNPN